MRYNLLTKNVHKSYVQLNDNCNVPIIEAPHVPLQCHSPSSLTSRWNLTSVNIPLLSFMHSSTTLCTHHEQCRLVLIHVELCINTTRLYLMSSFMASFSCAMLCLWSSSVLICIGTLHFYFCLIFHCMSILLNLFCCW